MRRLRAADAVTASRVPCAVLLVAVPAFSAGFLALYAWCGASDVLDGWLARRRGSADALGARLDSTADAVFCACAAISLVPVLPWELWIVIAACIVAAARIASYAIGYRKYHAYAALHTNLNKLTGVVLFCYPVLYLLLGMSAASGLACAIAAISGVEELVITLGSSRLDRDVGGLLG